MNADAAMFMFDQVMRDHGIAQKETVYAEKLVELDKYLTRLEKRSTWLRYLERAGIDNTEAAEYAIDLANEEGYFDNEDE